MRYFACTVVVAAEDSESARKTLDSTLQSGHAISLAELKKVKENIQWIRPDPTKDGTGKAIKPADRQSAIDWNARYKEWIMRSLGMLEPTDSGNPSLFTNSIQAI